MVHDDRGQELETTYLDENGKPTPNRDGSARVVQTFDAQGNTLTRDYFGPDGRPALHRNGYARSP
jgi:hypothetical protein